MLLAVTVLPANVIPYESKQDTENTRLDRKYDSPDSIKFPTYENQKIRKGCTNGKQFFGENNDSIYIIKVSSPYKIYLEDFDFDMSLYIIGEKTTSLACFTGLYLTNGTWFSEGIAGTSEGAKIGNFRYSHFKFGNFEFTNDKRHTRNYTGLCGREIYWEPSKPILPPGSWYFVFTGGVYDLRQQDILVHTKVWINFSNECQDLEIETTSGGKVYSLWYGEFDANVIYSKAWTFEAMLNGRANFHINNTFLYTFQGWPTSQGFWNVKWITPEGINKLNMIILRRYHIPDIDFNDKCVSGIGPSGDYVLINSYLDYTPLLLGQNIACPGYFVGVDVKLS